MVSTELIECIGTVFTIVRVTDSHNRWPLRSPVALKMVTRCTMYACAECIEGQRQRMSREMRLKGKDELGASDVKGVLHQSTLQFLKLIITPLYNNVLVFILCIEGARSHYSRASANFFLLSQIVSIRSLQRLPQLLIHQHAWSSIMLSYYQLSDIVQRHAHLIRLTGVSV